MFSVIIPLYNKEKYVLRSIKSVLDQTFTKFELIIVDDASTDNSLQMVKGVKDDRIVIVERKKRGYGGYAARNLGVEKAKYEYVSFLDADDEWRVDYLSGIKGLIEKYPQINVFSCAWTEKAKNRSKTNSYYNKNQKKGIHLIDNFYEEAYLGCNPLCTIVITIRKENLIDVGGFPEGKCKRGGDIETWLRLMHGNKLAWSPYIGAVYYKEINGTVTKNISDIEVPYVYYSAKKLLGKENNKEHKVELKKYANYYAKISILHSIVFGKNKKEVINGFFKDVDKKYYYFFKLLMIFPSFLLRPLYKLYRFLIIKFSKSDLG